MSVEDEVLKMTFDNATFERNAGTTLGTLDKLTKALSLPGASKGLQEIQGNAGRVNMSSLINSTSEVSKGFIALSTIAITALATITTKAIETGAAMIKNLTIDPILGGYKEYETNLNSIQTILANTKDSGANLDDVNAALAQLNKYSDKTIYNFSEMAKNIGTFTAAGVDLDTSVASIKGIANLAALSGSNSQQASTAMYQLSQAIAAGKVGLQDWNSVVNAGMGGATFQKALANTAVAMGDVADGAVKIDKATGQLKISGQSFRESIMAQPGQESWLSSEVLTNTLQQFTGDLSKADLAAQGFNDSQIKAIMSTAKTAQDAATKVKTITQLMDVAKETVGSGWAKTWQIVAGDFQESRKTFTNASNSVNGFLNTISNARNKILEAWKDMGGRNVAIEGIKNAFEALGKLVKPITNAFRDIFPPTTGKTLFDLTVKFKQFTDALIPSGETMEKVRRIFKGIFAAFDIGIQIVKGVVGLFGDLFGAIGGGEGSFLDFAARIGDMIYNFDQMLKKGDSIKDFFKSLGGYLTVPVELLKIAARAIGNLFGGFDAKGGDVVAGSFDRVRVRLAPLLDLYNKFIDLLAGSSDFFAGFSKKFAETFSGLGDAIGDALQGQDFSSILDIINTGLFAGVLFLLRRFIKKDLSLDLTGGLFKGLFGSFKQLTGTLEAMQNNIKANTLLQIAGAVALLTASIVVLSLIDSDKLTTALAAVAVGMGQLLIAMAILDQISSGTGFLKIPFIAGSMILLAGAILVLSFSVKKLSEIDSDKLAKGLGAIGFLLLALSLAVKPISAASGGMIRAGLGIIAISVALKILASAVADFSEMSWKDLIRGLSAVAFSLLAISGAMMLMNGKEVSGQALAVIAMATAVKILASAVADFAALSVKDLAKGLGSAAIALGVIAGAMTLMPPNMLLQSVALIAVAAALLVMGEAIANIGGLEPGVIATGILTIAAALAILAGGLYLMTGTLAGSAALLVAVGALTLFVPVLAALGAMSVENIVKGLLAIAGAFVVLGAAGLILGPLTPVILGLSVSLLAVGAGLALAGAGALAFATAFAIFAAAGTAGVAVIAAIVLLIPAFLEQFALGIIKFATTLAKHSDEFFKAFTKLLTTLIDATIKILPKIGELIFRLVDIVVKILVDSIPKLADAGLKMMVGLLEAIRDNLDDIVDVGADIVVKFLDGLGRNLPDIIDAGFDLIVKFINGMSNGLAEHDGEVAQAGLGLAWALINGMTGGLLGAGLDAVKHAAEQLADALPGWMKKILHINSPSKDTWWIGEMAAEGYIGGLAGKQGKMEQTAKDVGKGALAALQASLGGVSDKLSSDFNPTITPVLDLTQLTKDANSISNVLGRVPITAGVSYSQASSVVLDRAPTDVNTGGPNHVAVTLAPTYNVPKAPSRAELYLDQKSLISTAKEALG